MFAVLVVGVTLLDDGMMIKSGLCYCTCIKQTRQLLKKKWYIFTSHV